VKTYTLNIYSIFYNFLYSDDIQSFIITESAADHQNGQLSSIIT